jgi:hypothetical protein
MYDYFKYSAASLVNIGFIVLAYRKYLNSSSVENIGAIALSC